MILLLFFVWDPNDGQNLATSLSFGTIFFVRVYDVCVCSALAQFEGFF